MRNKIWMKRFVAIIISIIIATCIYFNVSNTAFASLLSCYVFILALIICDYKKNILAIAFLICFFVFLMGRPFVREVFGHSEYSRITLSDETRTCVYICLLLSLVSIACGYYIGRRINARKKKEAKQDDEKFVMAMKKVSKYATIFFYLLVVIENIFKCIHIGNVGYTASYAMEYDYRLPFGLHSLVMMAPVALAMFFATLPRKREMVLPVALFVGANLLTAISGNRFGIISCLLALMVYFVWRGNIDGKSWISGKQILCVVAMAPIVIVAMQYMTYWRDGNEINSKIDPIVGFMNGVGGSSDLIGAVEQYGDHALNEDVIYSFGGVWRGLNGNMIAGLIGSGDSFVDGQTVSYAKNAHSLSSALTYYFYRDGYLSGYGLGGCYIAELYHDLSFFGVVVGNLLIGVIIGLIGELKKNRVFYNFLCFFFIILLFRMPRDSFDYPITSLINLKNIFVFVVMYVIAKRICAKNKSVSGERMTR